MMPESYQHPLVYISMKIVIQLTGSGNGKVQLTLCLTLRNGKYKNFELVLLFYHSANNKRTALLRDIAHISFPLLTELLVYGNFLDSIEGIARTYLPCIQELDARTSSIQ